MTAGFIEAAKGSMSIGKGAQHMYAAYNVRSHVILH